MTVQWRRGDEHLVKMALLLIPRFVIMLLTMFAVQCPHAVKRYRGFPRAAASDQDERAWRVRIETNKMIFPLVGAEWEVCRDVEVVVCGAS